MVQGDGHLCGFKYLCGQYGGGFTVGNKIFKMSNFTKTVNYLKKNGVRHAYYAAKERIGEEKRSDYYYREPNIEENNVKFFCILQQLLTVIILFDCAGNIQLFQNSPNLLAKMEAFPYFVVADCNHEHLVTNFLFLYYRNSYITYRIKALEI